MRWKTSKEPKVNDKRIVRKFAYYPIKIEDEFIWLESFYVLEKYIFVQSELPYYDWEEIRKVTKENKSVLNNGL